MKILFLFVLILGIFCREDKLIPFSEMTVWPDESYFYYEFSTPVIDKEKDAYFYFKLSQSFNEPYHISIIDGGKNETIIANLTNENSTWISYKLPNLKTQTFNILVNMDSFGKMIFIDSTKEINTNLTNFIYFSFNTSLLEGKPPYPLIFNIDKVQNEISYYFKANSKDQVYESKSLIEYCIINGKECNFEEIGSIFNFEKGNKYKIRLNYYIKKNTDFYYFEEFSFIRKMSFGLEKYYSHNLEKIHYFLIDINGINQFSIFVSKRSRPNGYLTFITEKEKENLPNNLESFSFTGYDFSDVVTFNSINEKNYIIIKLKHSTSDNINILCTFNVYKQATNKAFLEIPKGQTGGMLKPYSSYSYNPTCYLFLSTKKNMQILDYSSYEPYNYTNNLNIIDNSEHFIYIDGTLEEAAVKVYELSQIETYSDVHQFNFVKNEYINYFLKIYGPDSLFMRTNSISSKFKFNITYLYDIEEKYYLYIKKYSGNMEIYEYNKELNGLSNYMQFSKIPQNLMDDDYKPITNKLLTINRYHLFSYYMDYNNLFDVYLQKVDDSNYININPKMFPFNNLVKLLNENKEYYLNFEVDHLIKLDNNFLDAKVTFVDGSGKKYFLNKENKVLRNLNGTGIKVSSDKKALIYFYKRIYNYSKTGVVVFDQSQKRKNLQFNIKNIDKERIRIYIAKDFGFEGYYPMLSNKSYIYVETNYYGNNYETTIYIDNIFDSSTYEPYEKEGEKYIIYIFDSFNNNIPHFNSEKYIIDNVTYTNNLLTPNNLYNFEFIEPNKNGSIILYSQNKYDIKYYFIQCKPKQDYSTKMKMKIYNSNKNFYRASYPIDLDIQYYSSYRTFDLEFNYQDQILYQSFETNAKFLLIYSFSNSELDYDSENYDYSITSLTLNKTLLKISFKSAYDRENKDIYYIIVGTKNDLNNLDSFADECYLAEIMTHNSTSESFIVKKIFLRYEVSSTTVFDEINVSKFNINSGTELVVNVICYGAFRKKKLIFYKPKTVKYIEPLEIGFNKNIEFDYENMAYFSFEYKEIYDTPQILYLCFKTEDRFQFQFYGPNFEQNGEVYHRDTQYQYQLSTPGKYYIKIIPDNYYSSSRKNSFILIMPSQPIDTIDLTKEYYMNSISIITSIQIGPLMIRVKNIQKDTNIIFDYFIENNYYSSGDYKNPFVVCEDDKNICKNNTISFKFLRQHNYSIYINSLKIYPYYSEYFFPSYYFFSVFDNNIETNKKGFFLISEPKIFVYDLKNLGGVHAYLHNGNKIISAYLNKPFTLDILEDIYFEESSASIISFDNSRGDYAIIIPIKKVNTDNDDQKIILVKKLIFGKDLKTHILHAGENEIILPNNVKNIANNLYNDYNKKELTSNDESVYGIIRTYSSSIKNMKYIISEDYIRTDYLVQSYFEYPIYVDEYNKDINIVINEYSPKYSLFSAFDNEIFNIILSDSLYKSSGSRFSIKDYFPLSTEINTDVISFYDYMNFYFYQLDTNITIYIKKYYGKDDLYECDVDETDKDDLSLLTKPLSICKNKKSIINQIFHFDGTKLITGYLGLNNYYEIFMELDDNNNNIIQSQTSEQGYGNVVKYLKKNIEYKISFQANHLVKLDTSFNAEVSIYNDDETVIILNQSNPVEQLKGDKFKIKSDKDVILYFYGKNYMDSFYQIKIEPPKGKNIEIKVKDRAYCLINFGFEGFCPKDRIVPSNVYYENQIIFMDNVYDKLKTRLINGEYLYIYTFITHINNFEISYNSTNLNHPNNEYSFLLIKNNLDDNEEKSLIINNNAMEKIKFQIIYCNSSDSPITMYYKDSYINNQTQIYFFNESTTMIEKIIGKMPFKLQFDSTEDFIFSYSFIDSTDLKFNSNQNLIKNRKELTDLKIQEVVKINPLRNLFNIRFNPNYKFSSTRYIIIIAPKNENNTIETFSSPCYITELVTEKIDGIEIFEIVDVGENEFISADIDFKNILQESNDCIIAIISQELRFSKKINFYIPYEYTYNEKEDKDKFINIQIEQRQEFGKDNYYFNLNYDKSSNKTEMLLLNYEIKLKNTINIIIYTSTYEKTFEINKNEGYINFLCEKSGSYRIKFEEVKDKNLLKDDPSFSGSFEIFSTERPFNIDIAKEKIEFNEFSIVDSEPPSLKLNINSVGNDYTKKISIANKDYNEFNDIVLISKDNQKYEPLKFNYYTFEKNSKYNAIINFNQRGLNIFTLEKINIQSYSLENIQDISLGNKKYNDIEDKFLIINWNYYYNITIKAKSNNPNFLIANITEMQSKNLNKEFQNIQFSSLKDSLNIKKPENYDYSVILIQLNENETEISFHGSIKNEDKGKEEESFPVSYIIAISVVGGIIILGIIAFLIIKFIRKKNNIDYELGSKGNLKEEELVADI